MSSFIKCIRLSLLLWMTACAWGWGDAPEAEASEGQTTEVAERLEVAEREWRLAEAAHRRVETQLRDMRSDAAATDEEVLAMETYVREMGELADVRRRTLEDLRKIAEEGVESDSSVSEGMEAFDEAVAKVPEAEDPESEREKMQREFEASLEEFDAMILTYNQELAARMDARMAKGENEAASHQSAASEAEELLRSMGVEPGGEATETAEASSETGEAAGEEAAAEAGSETASSETGAESGGRAGGGGRRARAEDEDIVARQLREAAEKETDPELREKLWQEYEAYLDGRS